MAVQPPFPFLRRSTTSPFTTQVQAQGGFFSGDGGSGTLLKPAPNLQTISQGQSIPFEIPSVPANARSYVHTIFGFFGGGSVGLRLDGCNDATCSSPVTLFLGTVNFPPNYVATRTVVSVIPQIANPCQYGTRLQPAAQFVYYVTPALIETWLVTIGAALAVPFSTGLYCSQLDANAICQTGPPTVPTLDPDSSIQSRETIEQLLRVVAWPNVCECIPGTPSPVPFPPPTIVIPTGLQQFPTTTITTVGDPAALTEILNSIHRAQATLAQIQDLTFAAQRYKAPFGTRLGRVTSISGQGEIGIATRLAGLRWDVTTEPPGKIHLPGNPDYVKDLGWISINEGTHMLEEHRVSQLQRDWFT